MVPEKQQYLIDKLEADRGLSRDEFEELIRNRCEESAQYLFEKARKTAHHYYGNTVYIRGLIEFTNYCRNNCYYCGIRQMNGEVQRYRLSLDEIMERCRLGYDLGFRTIVLQGGEDSFYTDEKVCQIIREMKGMYPDIAVTLSMGERSFESYQAFFEAGADRYLLRHETADAVHYKKLHPPALTLDNRKRCLYDLKRIGYQTGTGFMVGSPGQTEAQLAMDMEFIQELQPQMIGIGPFISQKDTPFRNETNGTLELTLFMIGLLRLMLPAALIPATTALGTIVENGREKGILAGANVVMPNLSPESVRNKYTLYDNKINTGAESAEKRTELEQKMEAIGYRIAVTRGDPAETQVE